MTICAQPFRDARDNDFIIHTAAAADQARVINTPHSQITRNTLCRRRARRTKSLAIIMHRMLTAGNRRVVYTNALASFALMLAFRPN